mmetsp:Transcript_14675/g.32369  ORF Transcript_14675/g.32369 Transcript_14675/m.32369 type:complete len:371 (+) Transcript_14675:347-1459(+)
MGVFRFLAAHETQLEDLVGAQQSRANPPGHLEGVVLELRGKNGTCLRLQLGPPIRLLGGVILIQRLDTGILTASRAIYLRTHEQVNGLRLKRVLRFGVARQNDPSVSVRSRRHGLRLLLVLEWVWTIHLLCFSGSRKHLLAEVLVDATGFKPKLHGRINILNSIVGRLLRSVFVNSEVVNVGFVALVYEDAPILLGHNDIPGVHRPRSRHESSQALIGGPDVKALLLEQLLNNRIVLGSGENGANARPRSLDTLQADAGLDCDSVELLVVLFELAGPQHILVLDTGRGQIDLAQRGKSDLRAHTATLDPAELLGEFPLRLDVDRPLLEPVGIPLTFALPLALALCLSFAFPFERLHMVGHCLLLLPRHAR